MTDHGRGEGERIGIYDDVQANQTDKGGGFPTPGPGDRLISETTNATECAASQPVTESAVKVLVGSQWPPLGSTGCSAPERRDDLSGQGCGPGRAVSGASPAAVGRGPHRTESIRAELSG